MRPKISIIGAGMVGAQAAYVAAGKELGDIVLVDVVEGVPQGKGLDLYEATPLFDVDVNVIGSNDYASIKGSDVVIVTAGVPRKSGMSRDELLSINAKIVSDISKQIVTYAPKCILIIVTNPLDAMVYVAKKVTKFPRERVFGMAGVLDSTRFRTFIADELKVSVEDVTAFVLGGHGDTMVPLARYSTVAGIPITELIPKNRLDQIIDRVRNGGGEIVNLLKTGSAFYAPGAAVIEMAEAVLKDKKRVLPCSVFLEGEYGVKELPIGVPVKLGAKGMEQVMEITLNAEEKKLFQKTVDAVKNLIHDTDKIM
ncbi:malate dehydrogenase [Candidatus Woesearchaeota archaeon]|nr:malate dehydrogenase [Candidatus Woesearchaeota archaeon]